MAAAEAMALGLAVVAAAVGGVPELVEHGRTGLLVQPDDPVALADAIEELLDDPERAASLGAAAARRAAELTPDRLTDAVVDVWRHALDA
jgi:starch synthase